jgi:DNA-binding CsgD family transcriptional regulator
MKTKSAKHLLESLVALHRIPLGVAPRRYALLDFTEKELRVVALRTSGVKPEEIARRMGAKVDTFSPTLRVRTQ